MDHIENLIEFVKQQYRDPYIVLGGDFNQWPAEQSIVEYPDMKEVPVGPTRADREIDRLFCNCLLYTSPSPRDRQKSRMPSSA